MNLWTQQELTESFPQHLIIANYENDARSMTDEEYETWIETMIGQPKPPA